MKMLPALLALFLLAGGVCMAEIELSGEANAAIDVFPAFPYTSGRFDSPINPGNLAGIRDLNLDTDVTFRLQAVEQTGAWNLWLALDPYRMSRVLLAAASGDPVQEEAVGASLLSSDPAALSILRAEIAWYIGPSLVLRLGRQSMLTGYGYGWNPMDFAGTVKDLFDPEAELKGVDALSLQLYAGNAISVKLAGILRGDILRSDPLIAGADYADIQAAAELTASFPLLELKLSGYYDSDDAAGEDAFVPALGAGFMLDLAGVGLYGEGALLWGGRVPAPVGVSVIQRPGELLLSGLFGVEYTFASELHLIAEYFYNGQGYSLEERQLYADSLEDQFATWSYIPGEYAAMYRPGYFAKHYLLLHLGYPIYPWNTNLELSAYYSPDSGALGVMPRLELEISGSLSARAAYTGLFSLQADRYDEVGLSPFRHMIELGMTYFF